MQAFPSHSHPIYRAIPAMALLLSSNGPFASDKEDDDIG